MKDNDALTVFPIWCIRHPDFVDSSTGSILKAMHQLNKKISLTPNSISQLLLKRTAKLISCPLNMIFLRSHSCLHLSTSQRCAFGPRLPIYSWPQQKAIIQSDLTASFICRTFELTIRDKLMDNLIRNGLLLPGPTSSLVDPRYCNLFRVSTERHR